MSARAGAATSKSAATTRIRIVFTVDCELSTVNSLTMVETDYLVIGSGIAGLSFALHAAEHGRVLIVTKRAVEESNTNYAQGGIAAVLDPADSFEAHVQDTLTVGEGLCHKDIVELCVQGGPQAVRELVDRFGARFDAGAGGGLDLAREGGHSARRVAHAKDTTGHEIERALVAAARATPNITVLDDHMAVDLLQLAKYGGPDACFGAYVLDERSGDVLTVVARATVLASGGAGKVYLYTTNPDVASGDGIAMAYRAGAAVANMEFIQFHPTCLFHPHAKSFLISEALRGEGGILRLPDGTRFMPQHDARAELAPRDIVARAIDFEMKRQGLDCVYIDMTHKPAEFLRQHFPTIYAHCLELGVDITREQIPVVPAAHYTCGGVVTDLAARTDLNGLYAIGETAFTGLHGANRLASNSLLECLAFSASAAHDILSHPIRPLPDLPLWDESRVRDADEEVVISHNWAELRR